MPKKVEGGVSLGALGLIGLSPAVRAARSTAGDSPISQGDKKTSAFFLGLGCALWSKFVRELPCLPGWCLEEGAPQLMRCPWRNSSWPSMCGVRLQPYRTEKHRLEARRATP